MDVDELRRDFAERQAHMQANAVRQQHVARRNATIAGGAVGLVAVALTAGVTRRAVLWHSFLLEAALCALAGWLLARAGGGTLRGLVLFSGAYLAAFALRGLGLDPSVLFVPGDLAGAAAVQGNVTSLAFVASCGLALGHVLES